ncbi:MAG: hypothetical protein ACXW2Q_06605 [Thermoanaerobaculia bacterium]
MSSFANCGSHRINASREHLLVGSTVADVTVAVLVMFDPIAAVPLTVNTIVN